VEVQKKGYELDMKGWRMEGGDAENPLLRSIVYLRHLLLSSLLLYTSPLHHLLEEAEVQDELCLRIPEVHGDILQGEVFIQHHHLHIRRHE
jgi:hypothetical protein